MIRNLFRKQLQKQYFVYPTLSFRFIYDLSILRKDTVKLGGLAHRLNAVAYDA